MMRSTLGLVIGVLIKSYNDLMDDPMNDHVGFTPDPMPRLEQIAAKLGWTFADIFNELSARGVPEKWTYDHLSFLHMPGEEEEPESRIIKDYDGGWFVVWRGQVCTPHFNSMGAAEAYRDMIKRGQRSPEYPS